MLKEGKKPVSQQSYIQQNDLSKIKEKKHPEISKNRKFVINRHALQETLKKGVWFVLLCLLFVCFS